MAPNVLITGAAGYIGGSIVADFLARGLFKKEQVFAPVRSDDQAQALSKTGINVLRFSLNDEAAVIESVLQHKIDIVIHTASSIDSSLSLPLITALGKRKEASGQQPYYIHTSASGAFYEKTGWPHGVWSDAGPIFEMQKQLPDGFPVRKVDVDAIEHAKATGVTSFTVVPPIVYGKGTGPWNKLSVVLPVHVKGSIQDKVVHKFPENVKVSSVHVADLTALYGLIVEKALRNEALPNGTEGYYFALSHALYQEEVADHLAGALKARGLVKDSKAQVWPSTEAAAEALGVPVQFLEVLWNSGDTLITENSPKIGWKPAWTYERFLQNIDDEVVAVLEEGKAKSSLIDSLHAAANGP